MGRASSVQKHLERHFGTPEVRPKMASHSSRRRFARQRHELHRPRQEDRSPEAAARRE